MTTPLVETKLFLPRVRTSVVTRSRLSKRLRQADDARLTLVAAPAGFGKTTLLATWATAALEAGRSVAWVSLDEGDHKPGTFWPYVVTALDRAAPGVGMAALPLLQSGAAIEDVLALVLNELSVLPNDLHLILDDYHLCEDPAIAAGVEFMLEHLPPQVHLVIGTRADPALPLARLRARGELIEIRAADLRFTVEEATTYLKDATGLDLAVADIEALECRTEGWIAALQLAALSIRGRDDIGGFIAGFAGDDRYVVDYLAEEVLGGQPDDVRRFLLETSVLDRLSGPLCDAVTGQRGGKAMLDSLDRANLFLVPLDDNRRLYRYHQLFADALKAHLLDERPDDVSELHRRASEWFASVGDPEPAVRHALAAGDITRAADLIEAALPALQRRRQEAVIRSWVEQMPAEVVRVRPVLALGLVGGLMSSNEFTGIDRRLESIEAALGQLQAEITFVDKVELDRVPAGVEMYRAALALISGDAAGTVTHAENSLRLAVEGDDLTRSAASALAGLASWSTGQLESAHRSYSIAVAGLENAGHISDVLGCSITLADIRITQGRLDDARRTYEQALELAARNSDSALRGMADMYVGLSQIACERNDLATAARLLQRSEELGEDLWLPQNAYRWRVALARVRQAQADPRAALDLLDDARRVYVGDYSPNVRPVPAMHARALVALGDLDGALAWVREQRLSVDDDLSYLREYEHVTLARVLLAQNAAGDAARLLDRLLVEAEAGGRLGTVIEILVVRALAAQASGDLAAAVDALSRALLLAEPEGYVRVFVGEGPPMNTLLRSLARQRPDDGYVRRLLAASADEPAGPADDSAPVAAASQAGLVDPLSERELEVLRLLATDLDGPGIARELVVSLNTVRTHIKHIYTKLGVNNRRAAVSEGKHLNLL